MFVNKILNFVDAYLQAHPQTPLHTPLGYPRRTLPFDYPHSTYYPIPGGAAVLTNKREG